MRSTITGLLVCLVLALESLEAGSHGELITPFFSSHHGGVVVDVVLDGHGPFRMIVDTGSTHSVITARVAAAIGATAVAQVELSTAAGSEILPVASVARLQVGPIAAAVLPTVVGDMPIASEADGLIGLDVLADRHFTLDYRHRRVIWHGADASPAMGAPTPVALSSVDGRFIVDAVVDGQRMPLVVDSASETLVLFDAEPARRRPQQVASLGTLARRVAVNVGEVATLRIGTTEQHDVRAVHLTRPVDSRAPAGLVPTHGFSRVTIDGPGRRLTVWK